MIDKCQKLEFVM